MVHDPTCDAVRPVQLEDGTKLPAGLVRIFSQPDEPDTSPDNVLAEAEMKVKLHGFKNLSDWLTVMILVSIKQALPGISLEGAKNIATLIGRQMANPGHGHRWRWAMGEIERNGMRGMLSRVKAELEMGQENRDKL